MGQYESLRAQARALASENEQEFMINHGNVDAFRDCLSPEMRIFFDDLEKSIERSKKVLKLFEQLEKKIENNEDPYYESSVEFLEEIYREVKDF